MQGRHGRLPTFLILACDTVLGNPAAAATTTTRARVPDHIAQLVVHQACGTAGSEWVNQPPRPALPCPALPQDKKKSLRLPCNLASADRLADVCRRACCSWDYTHMGCVYMYICIYVCVCLCAQAAINNTVEAAETTSLVLWSTQVSGGWRVAFSQSLLAFAASNQRPGAGAGGPKAASRGLR